MSTPEFNPNDQRTKINPEDLPPLEPTAEVPAVHSDKLNDPAYWSEKFEGKTAVVPKEHRDDRHKEKTGLGWKKPAAAMALVAATAAGVFGGAKALGGDTNTEPRQEPSASAPANPGETGETGETETGEPSAYDFVIPAAEYQNDPQALGNKYIERYNEFLAAGGTKEEASSDDRFKMGDLEYSRYISEDVDQAFTEDLFAPGWEDNPKLASYVNSVLEVGHATRHGRLVSYPVGTEEEVPYVRQLVIDEASGNTNPLTTTIHWHGYDNRHENNVEEVLTGQDPNTATGDATFTWAEVDGELKIASIDY